MKKNSIFMIGIMLILVVMTALAGVFATRYFTITKALIGQYDAVNWDKNAPIYEDYDSVTIYCDDRGMLHSAYANQTFTNTEHPGEYYNLVYSGNKLEFKNWSTEETLITGFVKGKQIILYDKDGNSAVYEWVGVNKLGEGIVVDKTEASKEIRANEEKRNKAFVGIVLIDILVIGFIAGAFVLRCKRKNMIE